jgi:hypothetical protein
MYGEKREERQELVKALHLTYQWEFHSGRVDNTDNIS